MSDTELLEAEEKIRELRAEIERREAIIASRDHRCDRLEAKIEWLRSALKDAADDLDHNGLPVEAKKARRALEGK
jgi:chromosome segregation ATPase